MEPLSNIPARRVALSTFEIIEYANMAQAVAQRWIERSQNKVIEVASGTDEKVLLESEVKLEADANTKSLTEALLKVQGAINSHNHQDTIDNVIQTRTSCRETINRILLRSGIKLSQDEAPNAIRLLDSMPESRWFNVALDSESFGPKQLVKSWHVTRSDFPELNGITDRHGLTYQQHRSYLHICFRDASKYREHLPISHAEYRKIGKDDPEVLLIVTSNNHVYRCSLDIATCQTSLSYKSYRYSIDELLPRRYVVNRAI